MIPESETLEAIVYFLFESYRNDHGVQVKVAPVREGYLYLWEDGNTHHSYRSPEWMGYHLV